MLALCVCESICSYYYSFVGRYDVKSAQTQTTLGKQQISNTTPTLIEQYLQYIYGKGKRDSECEYQLRLCQ